MKKFLLFALVCAMQLRAQAPVQHDSIEKFSYHVQETLVGQSAIIDNNDPNNLSHNTNVPLAGNTFSDTQTRISLSSTFYLGFRLGKNTTLYFNPDVAGGAGVSGTLGIGGYTNGEIFRVGNPSPSIYVSRLFIRQYISLKESKLEYVETDQNQLGEFVPSKRIQITIGKFSLTDIFDANHYSHDPRTRFLNWSLMNAGAYDFASNTKGYTYGIVIEHINPQFSHRFGVGVEPQFSNGPITTKTSTGKFPLLDMELAISDHQGYGFQYEIEQRFKQKTGKNTIIRFLSFLNLTQSAKYADAMKTRASTVSSVDNQGVPNGIPLTIIPIDSSGLLLNGSDNLVNARRANNVKYGFSLNIEYPVGPHAGTFSRISWNDGKTESFAFAEIDRSESIGVVFHGGLWHRYHDRLMFAFVSNQLSNDHRDFLIAGGNGFMLSPIKSYSSEYIFEAQFIYDLGKDFTISPDLQIVNNPGYDSSRGSLFVFGVRTHINF
jgi:high affinity Mn2+ porin